MYFKVLAILFAARQGCACSLKPKVCLLLNGTVTFLFTDSDAVVSFLVCASAKSNQRLMFVIASVQARICIGTLVVNFSTRLVLAWTLECVCVLDIACHGLMCRVTVGCTDQGVCYFVCVLPFFRMHLLQKATLPRRLVYLSPSPPQHTMKLSFHFTSSFNRF